MQSIYFLYVLNFLGINPRTWLPLDATILHCSDTFMLAIIVSFPFIFAHIIVHSYPLLCPVDYVCKLAPRIMLTDEATKSHCSGARIPSISLPCIVGLFLIYVPYNMLPYLSISIPRTVRNVCTFSAQFVHRVFRSEMF